MKMTKRLEQFIKETSDKAVNEIKEEVSNDDMLALGITEEIIKETYVKEYTDQLITDDFFCVVEYAFSRGIAIPMVLRGVLKEEKQS